MNNNIKNINVVIPRFINKLNFSFFNKKYNIPIYNMNKNAPNNDASENLVCCSLFILLINKIYKNPRGKLAYKNPPNLCFLFSTR